MFTSIFIPFKNSIFKTKNCDFMDIEFNKREDQNRLKLSEINRLLAEIKRRRRKRLQKLRDEGKMTARERIEYLLDKDSDSIEIGAFAGYEMYEEHGGCPSGGVVVVMGMYPEDNVSLLPMMLL